MVRTENLLLKAAKTLRYALPLGLLPSAVSWSQNQMIDDAVAYQHWPWRWDELEAHQKAAVERVATGGARVLDE